MSYVYLMFSGDRKLYKIGVAKNVDDRLSQLRTADPSIRVKCAIRVKDAYELETELHQRFADFRRDGEFFALGRAQVRAIENIGDSYWTIYRRFRAALRRSRRWVDYWLAESMRIAILAAIAAGIFLPQLRGQPGYPIVFMVVGSVMLWVLRN